MNWEYYLLAVIVAYAVIQFSMALLAKYAYHTVKQWKNSLLISHSIRAKLALTIFF